MPDIILPIIFGVIFTAISIAAIINLKSQDMAKKYGWKLPNE